MVLEAEWYLERRLQILEEGQRFSMLGKVFASVEAGSREPWKVCELQVPYVL